MNKFGTDLLAVCGIPQVATLSIGHLLIVDLVFAYLFPETGTVFLYATLVLGFFASVS